MGNHKPIIAYIYPKCSTCRDALKSLERKGAKPGKTVDIFETAPSPETLTDLIERSGLELKKFFNTSGEVYRELKLKDRLPELSREEQIELLASNGRLIKRPIIDDGSRVTVGYKEDEYERVWGGKR